MPIDPNEIKSIEDMMVHDAADDPDKVKGAALYLTLRFLSQVILGVYGVMLLGMLVLQLALRGGEKMPVSLSPESLLFVLPIALVAVYFLFISDPEPELAKRRTTGGRVATFVSVFVIMQVAAVALWVVTAKIFSLQ